jgi:hypothetical protein
MNAIRKCVRDKQLYLGNDEKLGRDSIKNQYNNEIRLICTVPLSTKVLESRIDEMNLKYYFIILDLYTITLIKTEYTKFWIISLKIKTMKSKKLKIN